MSGRPPHLYLARHGQTAWSLSGQHTGRQDIPLTAVGEEEARKLGKRLGGRPFAKVFRSPLQRATRTCELCGYGPVSTPVPELMEWDYGQYEGLRAAEIRAQKPDWRLFRDGCPGGEQLADVVARVDRILPLLQNTGGDAIVFAHGHLLRVLMARWAGLVPETAARFSIESASLSILTRDPNTGDGVVERWNDVAHLEP